MGTPRRAWSCAPGCGDMKSAAVETDGLPPPGADLECRQRFEESGAGKFLRFAKCYGCILVSVRLNREAS